MPYIGDKSSINATSSIFENFIEQNCLYVDKTKDRFARKVLTRACSKENRLF